MKKLELVTLLFSTVMLSACGGHQNVHKSDQYAAKDKNTLVKANGSEPDSLDPAHAQTNVNKHVKMTPFRGK